MPWQLIDSRPPGSNNTKSRTSRGKGVAQGIIRCIGRAMVTMRMGRGQPVISMAFAKGIIVVRRLISTACWPVNRRSLREKSCRPKLVLGKYSCLDCGGLMGYRVANFELAPGLNVMILLPGR